MPFPTADELESLPTLCVSQADDLKREIVFAPEFADVRIWLARGDTADGEPYSRTVTVETRKYIRDDSAGHWSETKYDGDEPPEFVGGLSAEAYGL